MTVVELGQQFSDEIGALWRQVGSLTRTVTVSGVRFDRVGGDIAELKADFKELRTDIVRTDIAGIRTDVKDIRVEVGAIKE